MPKRQSDSRRKRERASYKGRRAQDKEWWKPLDYLPERVRLIGRRLVKSIIQGKVGE